MKPYLPPGYRTNATTARIEAHRALMLRWGLPCVYTVTEEEADDVLDAIDARCCMSRGCVDGMTVKSHHQLRDVKLVGIWTWKLRDPQSKYYRSPG